MYMYVTHAHDHAHDPARAPRAGHYFKITTRHGEINFRFLPCQTCTQSTYDERCTYSWLTSNLLTSHDGLKGAYCNDKFLVMFSDGSPGFIGGRDAVTLTDIPTPPGGTYANTGSSCRTRSWFTGFSPWKIPLYELWENPSDGLWEP